MYDISKEVMGYVASVNVLLYICDLCDACVTSMYLSDALCNKYVMS